MHMNSNWWTFNHKVVILGKIFWKLYLLISLKWFKHLLLGLNSHSFDHNLDFKSRDGKSNPSLDIYILKSSKKKKTPNLNTIYYLHLWSKDSKHYKILVLKVGQPFGTHFFTFVKVCLNPITLSWGTPPFIP